MRCEKCGYQMDTLDRECRRCHLRPGQLEPDQASGLEKPDFPEEELRPPMEDQCARPWAQPTLVGAALGASIVSRSLYPSVWAYVVWLPAAVLGLTCGYRMAVRARTATQSSGSAASGPGWRFAGMLLIAVMLALNFPASGRHIEDPVVDVEVLGSGPPGPPPPATTWDSNPSRAESGDSAATALRTSPQAAEYLAAAGRAQTEGDNYAQAACDESLKAQRLRQAAQDIEAEPMRRFQEKQVAHGIETGSGLGVSGGEVEARYERESVEAQREHAEAVGRATSIDQEAFKHECNARDYEAMSQRCYEEAKRYRALAGWGGP